MKARKIIVFIVGALLLLWISHKLSFRTNTLYAIEYIHGIELPSSTTDTEFQSYQWWINVNVDGNGSIVKCKMNKTDFEEFLKKQLWCDACRGIGEFQTFPDTLIGKYPISNLELKSSVADTLLVQANELADSDQLEVWFYTDCN